MMDYEDFESNKSNGRYLFGNLVYKILKKYFSFKIY